MQVARGQVHGVKCKLQVQGVKCKLQVHGAKCKLQVHGVKCKLQAQGGPLRGSAWSRCKNSRFFTILIRPSAGIGVVEVQKLEVFYDFVLARATLCGDRRGRGAKTRGFLRFCFGPRDPLRGSAWSRCKNSRFFATFVV